MKIDWSKILTAIWNVLFSAAKAIGRALTKPEGWIGFGTGAVVGAFIVWVL